jgi:very-short-patch-repair endonuclease
MDERLDPLEFRRALRRRSTPAERVLWSLVRNRRLCGRKFRRQHPVGPFTLDFYCPAEALAIELDGPIHDDPRRAEYDARRAAALNARGIRVLHVPNRVLLDRPEAAAAWIAAHFRLPLPPPPG